MKLLATARFSDTVVKLGKLSQSNPEGLPEVAFVGRSNAGKSSCINLICNRRRLAFSSRTPGRTQALNLFAVGLRGPDDAGGSGPVGYLVDTPGYGFAAAAPDAKRSWQALAGDYIRQREPLAGVVLLVDIRRQLTELDRQLLSWMPRHVPLIIVLTKADKLSRREAARAMRDVAQESLLAERQAGLLILLFSVSNRTGAQSLAQAVEALLAGTPIGSQSAYPQPPPHATSQEAIDPEAAAREPIDPEATDAKPTVLESHHD